MTKTTIFLALFSVIGAAHTLTLNNTPVDLYFSPNGGATNAIVEKIAKGKKEILVQAYSFTSPAILNELVRAHQRGVKVCVVADKSNEKEKATPLDNIASQGIETFIDDAHAIAHNKIIIIDGKTLITGSFNFSKAAEEKNAENLLILENEALSTLYKENFALHKSHAKVYFKRGEGEHNTPPHHEGFFTKFRSLLGL